MYEVLSKIMRLCIYATKFSLLKFGTFPVKWKWFPCLVITVPSMFSTFGNLPGSLVLEMCEAAFTITLDLVYVFKMANLKLDLPSSGKGRNHRGPKSGEEGE